MNLKSSNIGLLILLNKLFRTYLEPLNVMQVRLVLDDTLKEKILLITDKIYVIITYLCSKTH